MTVISPRYTVADLGVLPCFESSRATALNDRGQIIGSLSREEMDFDPNGFIWADGIMRDLGRVWLKDINYKGQCVGARHPKSTTFHAALYAAGKFQGLLKNTSAASMAYGINDSGQVVGYSQVTNWKAPASTKRGCFLWKNGKRRCLDVPQGYRAGSAVAINNEGQIAGEVWSGSSSEKHACLWDADTVTVFEEPSKFNQSESVAINNHGHILVRAFHSDIGKLIRYLTEGEPERDLTEAADQEDQIRLYQQKIDALPEDTFTFHQQHFLWKDSGIRMVEGHGESVNDQEQIVGQVVGWTGLILNEEDFVRAESRKAPYAFLWQDGETLDLNASLPLNSGWRLTKANGINNKGQIAGYGEIGGKTRAFLLTPEISQ